MMHVLKDILDALPHFIPLFLPLFLIYLRESHKDVIKTVETKDEFLEVTIRLTNYILKKTPVNLQLINETELLLLLILSEEKYFVIQIKKNKRNKVEADQWYEGISKEIPLIWPDAVLRTDTGLFDENKAEPEAPSVVYYVERKPINETDLYV